MFIKDDLITCKKEASDNYAVTTRDGIYQVIEVGGDQVVLKVLQHSDELNIGATHAIPDFLIESDFEYVPEDVKIELKDKALVIKGWLKNQDVRPSDIHVECESLLSSSGGRISTSGISFFSKDVYSKSRAALFLPKDGECSYNTTRALYGSYQDFTNGSFENIEKYVRQKLSEKQGADSYTESFIKVDNEKFDSITEAIASDKKVKQVKMPDYMFLTGFSKEHKLVCFNTGRNYVYITNIMSAQILSLSASVMSSCLNVVFNKEYFAGLVELDFEKIMMSMMEDFKAISVLRVAKVKLESIEKFKKDYCGYATNAIKTSVAEAENKVSEYEKKLIEWFEILKLNKTKEFMVSNNIASSEDDFIKMIMSNKNISSIRFRGSKIHACVVTPMTYFEINDYKVIRGGGYSNFNNLQDEYKQLLDDIYLHGTVKLMIEQSFYIETSGGCEPYCEQGSYNRELGEGLVGFHNPHIQGHACFGEYKSLVSKAVKQGDITRAFSLCVAACSGINFMDSPVCNKMLDWIKKDQYQSANCLYYPDGTTKTISQYVKEYKDSGAKWKATEDKK